MDLTDQEKQIIVSLAENDMKALRVANKLFMHHNTVEYHIAKIKAKTGLNPKRFYDLIELLEKYT